MLHFVKDEIMSFEEFMDLLEEKVQKQIGQDYEVKRLTLIKNNGQDGECLVLTKAGRSIAPAIYLKAYYESYLNGTSFDELVCRLCRIYEHCSIPYLDDGFEYSYELMKSHIYYRLINYQRNETILRHVPHIKFLDLAITFHCLVRNDLDGIGSIRITNEHMKRWKVELDDIKKLSMVNTPQLFPPVLQSMEDMLEDLLGFPASSETMLLKNDVFSESSLQGITQAPNRNTGDINSSNGMYVLTNQKGINGASCLLYPRIIQEFAHKVNCDLVILPSSIHEVILLPFKGRIERDMLIETVKEVNKTQIIAEEYLSDEIYFYIKEKNVFRK